MKQKQVEKFKQWFGDYVARFYGDDEFVNANIELKDKHSRRVCSEMLFLAKELGLDANQTRIAEVIALFHDIGRFEQFVKYRTYNDPRSIDHCLLGLEVLNETGALEGVEKEEKQLIEKAIEYHGSKELPSNLNGQCLLLAKLIRDADKIDILYVVTDYYKQYQQDPDYFKLEVELPDEPRYSSKVVQAILNEQLIDYCKLQTWNDMKLLQLGWVYDVNFVPTLRRIKQRGLLEMIFEFLPQTEDIDKIRKKIFGYVDFRLENQ